MLISFKDIVRKYGKPKGILHLGANVGEEALAYEKEEVKKVIWIEANPEIYKTLVMNVAGFGHKTFNFCVGDENRDAILHISNNGSQSSSVLNLGTHKVQHPEVKYTHDIEVPMMRVDSFFSADGNKRDLEGIDFLNADLQGFELNALKGMGNLLNQFKYAYIEVNKAQVYEGCAHIDEIDEYLKGFGFRKVETAKWIGDWSDALWIKR